MKELAELGNRVDRMVSTRIQLMDLERLREAAKARDANKSGSAGSDSAEPAPEAEREEAVRRVCEILNEPCPPRTNRGPERSRRRGQRESQLTGALF